MAKQRTAISDLGEFELINHIVRNFSKKHDSSVKGIGDDAAVIDIGEKYQLISSDMLIEQVHFDLSYVPLQHLGYKAVSVNASDIYAMNGNPRYLIVDLALSNKFSVEAVDELYEGIRLACDRYNIELIGGDTTSSKTGLMISVTAIGDVEKQKVVYRGTAKEGDLICVSGDLGGAYTGLQVLEREKQVYLKNPDMQPRLDAYQYIVGRQLKVEARKDIIDDFESLRLQPTSMIDVSDGVASDLFHICKSSNVGAVLYEDKLPVSEEAYQTSVELGIDPVTSILNGGEDYEILFTIKESDHAIIEKHDDISVIGEIKESAFGKFLISKKGMKIELKAQGWKHF